MFNDMQKPQKYISLFIEKVIKLLEQHYLGNIDFDRIYLGALTGIVSTLDQYSNVFSESDMATNQSVLKKSIAYGTESIKNCCVGVITIPFFDESTSLELEEALKYYSTQNIRSAIIDLRDNPGGSVKSLVRVCNLLIASRPLFYSKDKNETITDYHSTLLTAPFDTVIAIVNNKTKSAAEMLALMLQESGGYVIGQQTFGKCIAQADFCVGGAILRVTTEEYYSYLTGSYNNVGITPDYILSDHMMADGGMILECAIKKLQQLHTLE